MSFKYLFTHAFPEIFTNLTHGQVTITRANPVIAAPVLSEPDEEGNTTVLEEPHEQEAPDGSTVVLRPGDVIESDEEQIHAHLEPIIDAAEQDAAKIAADAKAAADKAALKPAAPAAPVTPLAEAPAVTTTTAPTDTTKEV